MNIYLKIKIYDVKYLNDLNVSKKEYNQAYKIEVIITTSNNLIKNHL